MSGHRELDQPERIERLRAVIRSKPALRLFYADAYREFARALPPVEGEVLELGSGGGFLPEVVPGAITSDLIPYAGVDRVADALDLPFAHASLRAILMLNVFHHLPDAEKFLAEAERCLVPGGKIVLIDHHAGWLGGFILRFLHHETYAPGARDWKFASSGPLSGANTALTGNVFVRDREKLRSRFPSLSVVAYAPFSSFFYWLAGGLKAWTLVPGPLAPPLRSLDRLVARAMPLATYVRVEIAKKR